MNKKISIAIHGGAGTLLKSNMTTKKEKAYQKTMDEALSQAYKILEKNGSAMDAVVAAVEKMENSPLFNAGKGSVFTNQGTHEMDAAVMDGNNRKAGAVSLVTGIKNPIRLAKDVMNRSPHVFLAGEGAIHFAKELDYELKSAEYFYDKYRFQQWQEIKDSGKVQLDHSLKKADKFGTVGAVACDRQGNLAAATSTGGLTNKKWGRIGDSSIIGGGTYANNKTCAVSCTGDGEYFIRGVVAYDVSCLMELKQMSLKKAADEVIQNKLYKLGGEGGLIATDANGNIAMPFNTEGMYRAYQTSSGSKEIKIYKD